MQFCATAYLAALLVFSTCSSARADAWLPWKDLANFKPNGDQLIAARSDRGHPKKKFWVQRVADGSGSAINVDEYIVRISKLPAGVSKKEFFKHLRVNLNSFLDQSIAEFYPFSKADEGDWKKLTEAQLGTIMIFKIYLPVPGFHDEAAVVVSRSSNLTWTFSPIKDGFAGGFGTHPVAGNRQFGMREGPNGSVEFFTRAFDRVYQYHASYNESAAFKGADALWKSLQRNVVAYVASNGGTATIIEPNVPGKNDPKAKPRYSTVCADPVIELAC